MGEFVSEPVPFQMFGNRRGLTFEQICNDVCLSDFVRQFSGSFEIDHARSVALFIEPDAEGKKAATGKTGGSGAASGSGLSTRTQHGEAPNQRSSETGL